MSVKQLLLAIDEQTTTEVFVAGDQQPILCVTHPFAPPTGKRSGYMILASPPWCSVENRTPLSPATTASRWRTSRTRNGHL
ncbi:hypothetical protein [Dictyobacter aurantiacus]|uniref:hypothetical protein n=1 Tax=Dictyobacter aurantiacus TaxID=1936993 RepID=UPI000F846E50|nr:hypothetical protein [Dictyobacter aurantiacus]